MSKRRILIVALTAALSLASGFSRIVSAQQPDGAAVYKAACAPCHDQPQGRTPSLEALKDRTLSAVLRALNGGSMAIQAEALSQAERRAVSEFVAGKPVGSVSETAGMCSATAGASADSARHQQPSLTSIDGWNGWGLDLSNSRYQPKPGLTAAEVPNLKLKWAFGFPNSSQAYGHPAIIGGRVFVGSDNGRFYVLDANTGCIHWSFEADGGIRTAPSVGALKPGGAGRYAVYFGDIKGSAYAIDATSGELIWKKKVDDHTYARVTGAPTLHDGRLYVPVSSVEEVPAAQPGYQCCTFRGSVVALDAATGSEIWKSYTVPEAPQPAGRNAAGTQLWKGAGAAVWSAPTIDPVKGVLYVGTGNSYTAPAVDTSDSVMAMDLKTGKILWWNQVTQGDAFVIGCRRDNANCPKELGPDYDFGNSPILRSLPGGKQIIVIGQKSGVVYGLDPDNKGKVVWQFKAGKGSSLGGIEWGSAADDQNAYIPVSDVLAAPADAGGLFALKLATGEKVWNTPAPKLECTGGRGCTGAQSAPVSVIPGVVFSGSVDGHLRAYSTSDGSIIWDYNTAKEFETVNRVPAKGGSIDAAGPAIADGFVLTNSGYALWKGLPGNVLLAFSAK